MATSSGIAMDVHYCMGKQAGIEFYGNENKKCGRCGMTEKKGCCSDEHSFYKLDAAHKNVNAQSSSILLPVFVAKNPFSYSHLFSVTLPLNHFIPSSSPPQASIAIYIFAGVFRI